MKVYLSVPMIANRALERASLVAEVIRSCGHELVSPWVLGEIERSQPGSVNIFQRDMKGAEGCDIIVADVSQPSTGVGMELMAAYKAGRRIITLAKRGSTISRMLMHMDGKEMIEFDDDTQLARKLAEALRRPGEQRQAKGGMAELRSGSAPEPIGPYSQGVSSSGLVFCSGQIGIDPATGRLEDGIVAQTRRALQNLREILLSAGLDMQNVVKTTVFMSDMAEFPQMNEEYTKHFSRPFPARSTVQAAALPRGARVEIDAIASSA
jgi:2-iminobutanoate/2-iminopropanoate deaminase